MLSVVRRAAPALEPVLQRAALSSIPDNSDGNNAAKTVDFGARCRCSAATAAAAWQPAAFVLGLPLPGGV